jgi:hypothetical protein
MTLTGHCLCKAVTYTVDVDAPLLTGYDHCDDCQRQSGSTYCESLSSIPPLCAILSCQTKLPRSHQRHYPPLSPTAQNNPMT